MPPLHTKTKPTNRSIIHQIQMLIAMDSSKTESLDDLALLRSNDSDPREYTAVARRRLLQRAPDTLFRFVSQAVHQLHFQYKHYRRPMIFYLRPDTGASSLRPCVTPWNATNSHSSSSRYHFEVWPNDFGDRDYFVAHGALLVQLDLRRCINHPGPAPNTFADDADPALQILEDIRQYENETLGTKPIRGMVGNLTT